MPGTGVKNSDDKLGGLHGHGLPGFPASALSGVSAAQIAAASALARADRWQSLHEDTGLLWGHIRGSGGTAAYQVACAIATVAFACSCPAFATGRRPCKHG